jgi:hypothetical protein
LTPDPNGLAQLCALVCREQLALAGPGYVAMSVGTKPPPAPGRGSGGSSYSSEDPEQERIAALVTLAQQGDGEAFGQIYDRYVDSVYRYLYYRVGTAALAEDLTSETFGGRCAASTPSTGRARTSGPGSSPSRATW